MLTWGWGAAMASEDSELTAEQRTELAKLYFNAAQDSSREYDQRVFWLIGGAAAAFAFLEAELPHRDQWSLVCLLILGWIALFIALVSIMLSFLMASSTHYTWAKYWLWDDESCGNEAAERGKRIRVANWTAFITVLSGIGLIGLFLTVNML